MTTTTAVSPLQRQLRRHLARPGAAAARLLYLLASDEPASPAAHGVLGCCSNVRLRCAVYNAEHAGARAHPVAWFAVPPRAQAHVRRWLARFRRCTTLQQRRDALCAAARALHCELHQHLAAAAAAPLAAAADDAVAASKAVFEGIDDDNDDNGGGAHALLLLIE